MLFNSYAFIFAFLPVTAVVFFQLASRSHGLAAAFLVAASLFFYGWWNPAYIGLLLGSIIFNYGAGMAIAKAAGRNARGTKRLLLWLAVLINLALLGYYKYANFFISNLNQLAHTDYVLGEIILPLGISFFTFTQIAFLVDTFRGEVKEYRFLHYALFVTYFPHLIAGPILHHKEIMPQFSQPATYRFGYENLAVGLTIFAIGLFKKTFLADGIAPYANATFRAADASSYLSFVEAWVGALSYTLQLYFDFSGYSDMAIGLSRMFGVTLPLNFASPYKARDIIEFWRRWHMTLSRFLRDYLYIPLGGNKKGPLRRYGNIMATMLLGGLWHGAAWNFVLWGALHGVYLVINHGWRALRRRALGDAALNSSRWWAIVAGLVTFIAVVIAWVFFRATTLRGAYGMLGGMSGRHGFAMPESWVEHTPSPIGDALQTLGLHFTASSVPSDPEVLLWISALLLIVWVMPNTQESLRLFAPALGVSATRLTGMVKRLTWRPTLGWALVIFALGFLALTTGNDISEFLYFQF